jgi:hypothetical protein
MRPFRRLILPIAVLALAAPAFATEPDAETRTAVIEEAIALLDELYVIPETAARVGKMLRENLAAGKYDDESSAGAFAAAVTRDMQDLTRDKHLRLSWGEGGDRPTRRVVRRIPDGEAHDSPGEPGRVVVREGGPGEPGGRSDGGAFDNVKGIPEAKMLPGNVGYIDIRLFVPLEMQEDDAVQAMATVADADAIIFDLRTCMGGTPDMVHFITSYLYPPEPMHLLTYYHGHTEPDSAYTLAEVPGRRRPDVDVWIVTSELTGSGCEEFTYNLKHHERATVVGRTTGGAGHGGGVHALSAGFNIFVPDFRPVHPKTGTGWEVVGVVPHVDCDAEKALTLAHKMALEKILESGADEARRRELGAIVAELDAELARADEPEAADLEALAEYAGSYEQRTIFLEDDGLWLQRAGGPKLQLAAGDGPDSWSLKRLPQAKLEFVRGDDGKIRELRVLGMRGTWEVSMRE